MSSTGGSFGAAHLHVGADGSAYTSTYPEAAPILTINAGESSLTIFLASERATTADRLAFAHSLAAAVTSFTAECERLHQAAQQDSGAASSAA